MVVEVLHLAPNGTCPSIFRNRDIDSRAMPKFGSHIIFAEQAATKRPDLFPRLHPNALRFGAVGPDTTLFMFDPATNKPELRLGVETALNVLEAMQDIKDQLREIQQTLSRPVDDLADYLSGGLTRDLSYTVEASIEALFLTAKLGIAFGVGSINVRNPIFDRLQSLPADFIKDPTHAAQTWTIGTADRFGFPFRMFGHPLTDDGNWKKPEATGDYSNWWWMDLLHYRKTGQFASALLSLAKNGLEESYARGYMTHVAGDVTGHPFINSLVGGPFRNHAYRHLVLETLADTWLWNDQGKGDILDAGLQRQIDLGDSEARQIASLVVRAMRAVYSPPMVPKLLKNGYPDASEFLSAYRILKQYLRLSTGGSVHRPDPPPDSIAEVWDEIKDLIRAANPGPPPVWNGNILDFLVALFSWAAKGLVLLAMLASLPRAVMTRLLTGGARWVIYLFNLGVYFIISAIRTMLCLTGWGYAGAEDFATFGFLKDLVSSKFGGDDSYPYRTGPNPKPPFYWLLPTSIMSTPEQPITLPLMPNRKGLLPDWMVNPANRLDPALLPLLRDLAVARTPGDTVRIERQLAQSNGFGNAVDFSLALLSGSFPIPDLDLDGDRGYGFRGWQELPPNSGERYE